MNRYLHFVRGVSPESLASTFSPLSCGYSLGLFDNDFRGGVSLHKVFAVRRISLASATSLPGSGKSLTQVEWFQAGLCEYTGVFSRFTSILKSSSGRHIRTGESTRLGSQRKVACPPGLISL
jgi:hypothetical protein